MTDVVEGAAASSEQGGFLPRAPSEEPGAAAFDRPLTFTLYERMWDKVGLPVTRTWGGEDGWIHVFAQHEVRGSIEDTGDVLRLDRAKDGWCLVLGAIPEGQSHKNALVTEAHALGLDLDGLDEAALDAVLTAIAPYEFALYTTHKHGSEVADGAIKIRVILPTRAPYEPKRHKQIWQALQRMVGGRNDENTKNVARLFYLPSTFDITKAEATRNEGAWIDVEELLAQWGSQKEREVKSSGSAALLRMLTKGRCGPGIVDAARAVAEGAAFADPGKRHETMLDLTAWLAQRSIDAPFSSDAIREVFGPSYVALAARDGEAPDVEDAVRAYEGAIAKVGEWEADAEAARDQKAVDRQLEVAAPGQGRYDDDELVAIAKTLGLDPPAGEAAQALRRRWIIQAGDAAYYVLAGDGGYRGPFGTAMGRTAAVEVLARAPVLLNEPLRNGGFRRRGIQELTEDYGMCATEVVVDLTRDRTWFDERSRRLYEAARPVRQIQAHFDEQIDGWLRAFAGAQYGKLCDWLACVFDLRKLLCALYIDGEPGAGKTMLAYGLAKGWTDGNPAEIDRVLLDMNDEIVRCPLALADEALPKAIKGNSVTTKLRSMLSTQDRTLRRLYVGNASLRGAVRLIITANNEFLLSSKDLVSAQDVEAIAQRFLYIKAPQEATDILAALSRPTRDAWLSGGIAAHAKALSERREVTPGRRFWVEGDVSTMHRLLTFQNESVARVCEMLARILNNPAPYLSRNDGLIRWGKGQLFVNVQGIIDCWSQYFPDTKVEAEASRVGAALRAISSNERPHMRWQGKRFRYYQVKPDMVLAWSDMSGIGDKGTMQKTLWDGLEPEREPGSDDGDEDSDITDAIELNSMNSPGDPF